MLPSRPADKAINGDSQPNGGNFSSPRPLSGHNSNGGSNGGSSSNGNGSSGAQSAPGDYVDNVTFEHFPNDSKNPNNNSVVASDGRIYQRKSVLDAFERGGNKFPIDRPNTFPNGTLRPLSDEEAQALVKAGDTTINKTGDKRDLARANVVISVLKRIMKLSEHKQHAQLPNARQELERLQSMYRQLQPLLEAYRQEKIKRKTAKAEAEAAMQDLFQRYDAAYTECEGLKSDLKKEQRRANKLEARLAEESTRCKQYQMESLAQQSEIAALKRQLALAESKASKPVVPVDSKFVPPLSLKKDEESYDPDFEDEVNAEAANTARRLGIPFTQPERKGNAAASNGNNGDSSRHSRDRSTDLTAPSSPVANGGGLHLSPNYGPGNPHPLSRRRGSLHSPQGEGHSPNNSGNSPQPLSLGQGMMFRNSARPTPILTDLLSGRPIVPAKRPKSPK